MKRIGIITCSNCTQDANCASVVCLGDLRKRRGIFSRYPADEKIDLIGMISCAGCPTLAAPEKILRRIAALAQYRLDALHFSYCMTALCPFLKKYKKVAAETFPDLELVMGTHEPKNSEEFRRGVKEILCPGLHPVQDMNDLIRGTLKIGDKENKMTDTGENRPIGEAEDTCDGCGTRVAQGKLHWKKDWDMWVCRECLGEDECGCSD